MSVMLLRWLVIALALAGGLARAAEMHGIADAYATPGVAVAWAVARGSGAADAVVVIRVAADAQTYPYLTVAGIDPFTQQRKSVHAASRTTGSSGGGIDVRVPRAHFADFPRTELRLFATETAMLSDKPDLVVYYLGVPDTTPEFATAAALEAYLGDRIGRLKDPSRSKAP
jgi:hypothetical protein